MHDRKSKSKKDRFKQSRKTLKPKLEEMHNNWLAKKAEGYSSHKTATTPNSFMTGSKPSMVSKALDRLQSDHLKWNYTSYR